MSVRLRQYAELLLEDVEGTDAARLIDEVGAVASVRRQLAPLVRAATTRAQVAVALHEAGISQSVQQVVTDLARERHLDWLAGLERLMIEVASVRGLPIRASVVVARESALDRAALTQALETVGAATDTLRVQEAPGLMGGILIRLGDRALDATISHRLVELKQQLKPRKLGL